MLQTFLMYLIVFAIGVATGVDIIPALFSTREPEEYILDDMEISYVKSGSEIIHGVAQVEVGESFVIMLDRENSVKVIIPNREIEYIKSIRKDIKCTF